MNAFKTSPMTWVARLAVICAWAAFFASWWVSPTPARAATLFVVNVADDWHDASLSDNVCSIVSPPPPAPPYQCSFRAAVEQAAPLSSLSNPVTIHFDFAGGSTLALTLDTLQWTGSFITVDGIGLDLTISTSNLGGNRSTILMTGSYNTVRDLTIAGGWQRAALEISSDPAFSRLGKSNTVEDVTFVSSKGPAIFINGNGTGAGENTIVRQSLLGTTTTAIQGCTSGLRNQYGIRIASGTHATQISQNTIACSTLAGILDAGGTETVIENNVISGNEGHGVWLNASNSALLTGNKIGVNAAGGQGVPNAQNGIFITGGAVSNVIGGSDAAEPAVRNIISGNGGNGVLINGNSGGNRVDFNIIGLNAAGAEAIPNGGDGVAIVGASDNVIGSDEAGVKQYISGNSGRGIYVADSANTAIGLSNQIGIPGSGSALVGNAMHGIYLYGATNSMVTPTVVRDNGMTGLAVVSSLTNPATGNLLRPLQVYENGWLPIDLGDNFFTANGTRTPPGPNNWIRYPDILNSSELDTTVQGKTCPNCEVDVYQIYSTVNPAMFGGGGTFVTTLAADANGDWTYPLPVGWRLTDVTFVSVDPTTHDTSEMSLRYGTTVVIFDVYLPVVAR